jgi:hypothetical protein
VRIGLCPDRLVVSRRHRGLRPAVAQQQIVAGEPPSGAAPWQPSVDALPSALVLASGRPEVTVVLSNHFVRYALLPWIPALKTDDEWLALARHRLALVHGQTAEDWVVRCSETAPRGTRVACAVDRALIEALDQKITDHGGALVSVQPYLMAAFNHIRAAIGGESGWVVIQEPGRLTLALIQEGNWTALRSRGFRRADDNWRAMLPEILQRESAVLGLEQPCSRVLVYTPEAFETGPDGMFAMEALPAAAGAAPGERAFAMVQG